MDVQREDPAEEVRRFRRCINDLVGLVALPAIWNESEPAQVVRTLLDVLLGMLGLDVVYVRLRESVGDAPIEMARLARSLPEAAGPREVGALLDEWLGRDPQQWPSLARKHAGDGELSIVSLGLGLKGDLGVIVAGSRRAGFPGQTEKLLLDVATNQAAIGLHRAQLLGEQKRVARELDERVAQRTAELAAANEELRREITERMAAEERRRRSEKELGRTRVELARVARVTTLGALTASIAHEVSQPLSGILTNASTCQRLLAADPPDVEGARETVRRTLRDADRASDVVKRLRALFAGKDGATEAVDLNEAVREIAALSSRRLERDRIVLEQDLAGGLPPVTGDRIQLQQVVLNLLLNAAEALSEVRDRPRQVVIRTERDDGDGVRLSVRDSGVGLDPRSAERIFDAFYTTKSSGMGIGLSVSRSIIESHRGSLRATANDGPGATFSFSLPRRAQEGADGPGDERTAAVADAAQGARGR